MSTIRVTATQPGFYDGSLRQPGATFDLDVSILEIDKVSGEPILPRWCVRAEQTELAARRIAFHGEAGNRAGALAASGQGASGGAATQKMKDIAEQVPASAPEMKVKGKT